MWIAYINKVCSVIIRLTKSVSFWVDVPINRILCVWFCSLCFVITRPAVYAGAFVSQPHGCAGKWIRLSETQRERVTLATNISQSNGIKWHKHPHTEREKERAEETIRTEWKPLWKIKFSCFSFTRIYVDIFSSRFSLCVSVSFVIPIEWFRFIIIDVLSEKSSCIVFSSDFPEMIEEMFALPFSTHPFPLHGHSINRPLLQSLFIQPEHRHWFFSNLSLALFRCCSLFVKLIDDVKANKQFMTTQFLWEHFGLKLFRFRSHRKAYVVILVFTINYSWNKSFSVHQNNKRKKE